MIPRSKITGRPTDAPVVLSPFANEALREWPLENFRRFIEIGLDDGRSFAVCGTRAHRAMANELVRSFPSHLVQNCAGNTTWRELTGLLVAAPFVVANNSGIAHLSASLGLWVLCVFGGRHSWAEWMPRGSRVVTIARTPSCSPCDAPACPNDLACLREVEPAMAYLEIVTASSGGAPRTPRASG